MKHQSTLRIGMLVASVAALIISIGLYWYLYHDTLALTEHAVLAKSAGVGEGDREKQSKAITALASSTASSRAKLSTLFVPADDAVAFIQAVESTGPASGATVAISSINESATDGVKKGTIGYLTAHITVNGSWSSVMNALELFEVFPYKVNIDHFTFNTSIGASDRIPTAKRNWQATFDISASTLI